MRKSYKKAKPCIKIYCITELIVFSLNHKETWYILPIPTGARRFVQPKMYFYIVMLKENIECLAVKH